MIKTGQIGLDDNDLVDDTAATTKKCKINQYAGYTDAVWGAKTRGWAASTSRLDQIKWKAILTAAVEKINWSGADEGDTEDGANGGALDPRALIEI